jgi:hypothetical protein
MIDSRYMLRFIFWLRFSALAARKPRDLGGAEVGQGLALGRQVAAQLDGLALNAGEPRPDGPVIGVFEVLLQRLQLLLELGQLGPHALGERTCDGDEKVAGIEWPVPPLQGVFHIVDCHKMLASDGDDPLLLGIHAHGDHVHRVFLRVQIDAAQEYQQALADYRGARARAFGEQGIDDDAIDAAGVAKPPAGVEIAAVEVHPQDTLVRPPGLDASPIERRAAALAIQQICANQAAIVAHGADPKRHALTIDKP